MAITASVITDASWILSDNTGNKIGIMSYNAGKGTYLLVTPDMDIALDSFDELESILGTIKVKERTTIKDVHKDLNGYSICHESAENVRVLESGLIKYTPAGKSKKDFYAGYWATISPEGLWFRRVSLSVEMHEDLSKSNGVQGPYKDKFECQFMVKKLNDDR